MKNRPLLTHSLLAFAMLSALGTGVASADASGVNAILAAAAGNKTHMPVAVTPPAVSAKPVTKPAVKSTRVIHAPVATAKPIVAPTPQVAQHSIPPRAEVHAAHPAPMMHSVTHPALLPMRPNQGHPVLPPAVNHREHSLVPPTHPSPTPSPAAQESAGYINPFMGAPGVEQKLSNRLELLKIKTEIAKEQTTFAKYAHESNLLENARSPQMQQLQATVSSMQARLVSLEQKVHHSVHAAQATAVKHAEKANDTPILTSILADMNSRSAIISLGKHLHTVTVGDRIAGQRVMSIHLHSVRLSNGEVLHLQAPIGHYLSTTWKASQNHGRIEAPQANSLATRLAEEARQSGIRLPAYGSANTSHMPPLPALNPAMLQHPGQP